MSDNFMFKKKDQRHSEQSGTHRADRYQLIGVVHHGYEQVQEDYDVNHLVG